jgi:outer membrane protein OmpA-like peptidoglycan-associated protein
MEGTQMRIRQFSLLLSPIVLLLMCVQPVLAQRGKLIVRANPREAYIYADGEPVVEARGHYVTLPAGEHRIDLYNYGYKPASRTVTIEAHKTIVIDVKLDPVSGDVNAPWGCITLEGAAKAAVLMNGKEPEIFFVGHGDEFNHEWGWHQELIVPPGKQQLTVQYMSADPWTISVDVQANKRIVIAAYKGVEKTVDWSAGERMKELPKFQAGFASAKVAVQKVTGQFSSAPGQINCGDSAQLTWSSTGAGKVTINDAVVSDSGNQTVQPKQTTDYKFVAAGPGGIVTSDSTVNVNTAIAATLSVSPAEVRYHKIGEKVDQQGTATVTWSAPGADTVSVDPLGSVNANGNRDLQITPTKTSPGPIDETVTYTLHASNACGGSATQTASLHITGSIEVESAVNEATLETKLTFNSVYFPYNLPTAADPQAGLVPSQDRRLDEIVTNFKEYLTVRPEAKLILGAHADVRGTVPYNKALSQRRADRVKSYLVEHGIPADSIQTEAFGKEHNLTDKEVEDLTAKNPNLTPEERKRVDRNIVAFRMANNRRVDIRLSTTGQTSLRYYPMNSDDLNVLLGEQKPAAKMAPAKKAPVKKAAPKK